MCHVGVAAVELEHIDAPVSKRLCVKLVVIQCSREPSTRPTTNVFIHAQLQAFGMYLQRKQTTSTTAMQKSMLTAYKIQHTSRTTALSQRKFLVLVFSFTTFILWNCRIKYAADYTRCSLKIHTCCTCNNVLHTIIIVQSAHGEKHHKYSILQATTNPHQSWKWL